MKVLIAEDDEMTREGLAEILEEEGYTPILAADGIEAIQMFTDEAPDFVCLDIMMPGQDGYAVCKQLRKRATDTPIIFISAKGEEIDKVLGLELGADDFIVKPFGVKEVIARIRAVTRRYMAGKVKENTPHQEEYFMFGDLAVYSDQLRARRGEECIDLSLRDVKFLELFYLNPGKVLDRLEIFRAVWGLDYLPNSRTLDQHISQLRKRIEIDPKAPELIKTVHGAGYRYDEEPD